MSTNPSSSPEEDVTPPKLTSIIVPSLQVGGLSGASGLLFGGVAGVLKSNTPALFAIASGIQWFALGSTFCAARCVVFDVWRDKIIEPREKILASSFAGAIGGGVSGLLRGRKNIVPGMLMFAIFGAVGQKIYNIADARHDASAYSATRPDTMTLLLNSKWSPVKVLSDEEYKVMLKEKLIRLDAEIALIDNHLARLSSQSLRQEERG